MITEAAKKRCIAHSLQEQLAAHRKELVLAQLEGLTLPEQIKQLEQMLTEKDKA